MDKGQKILMKGSQVLAQNYPYFEPAVDRLRFESDDNINTLSISSNLVIYYNNEFVSKLDAKEIPAVIMHELLHFLCDHHKRYMDNPLKDASNRILHNIAMDMEINTRLESMKYNITGMVLPNNFKLPDGSLTDYPKELTYEVYYKRLINDISQQLGNQNNNNGNNSNNNQNTNQNDNNQNNGNDSKIEIYGSGSSSKSCNTSQSFDEVKPESSLDSENLIDSVKDLCETAGKEAGNNSGGELANAKVTAKKYPWNIIFRNVVSKSVGPIIQGYDFRCYCRYNKRNSDNGILLPIWRSRKVEINICIIMDVSGSMYDNILNMYSKMKSIANMISEDIKIKILETDTKVLRVIDNFDINSNKITYTNGGGTDLRSGWKYIYDNKLNPDLIICFTDGYTDYPSESDPYYFKKKTVCIITDNFNNCPYKYYPSEF